MSSLFETLAEKPLDTDRQPKALGLADTVKTAEKPKPEESEEQKQDKQAIGSHADKVSTGIKKVTSSSAPVKITSSLPNLGPKINNEPTVKKGKDRIDEILERLNQLPKERLEASESTQWANVAEQVGHALTQIGSGMYGLKHNVDMSGVKFNKTSWADLLDKRLKIIDTEMGQLERELGYHTEKKQKAADLARQDKLIQEERAFRAKESAKDRKAKATKQDKQAGKFSYANFKADDDRLSRALDIYKKPDQMGTGVWAHVPKEARSLAASALGAIGFDDTGKKIAAGVEAERNVEAVVQKSLRQVLGGQFAQKEGERLIGSMFDPRLPVKTVIKNVERIQSRLRNAAQLQAQGQDVEDIKELIREDINKFEKALDNQSSAQKKPSKRPKKGHEEGGYRFKGGDPSKQENWEKI